MVTTPYSSTLYTHSHYNIKLGYYLIVHLFLDCLFFLTSWTVNLCVCLHLEVNANSTEKVKCALFSRNLRGNHSCQKIQGRDDAHNNNRVNLGSQSIFR